jgi:hypothetical protein
VLSDGAPSNATCFNQADRPHPRHLYNHNNAPNRINFALCVKHKAFHCCTIFEHSATLNARINRTLDTLYQKSRLDSSLAPPTHTAAAQPTQSVGRQPRILSSIRFALPTLGSMNSNKACVIITYPLHKLKKELELMLEKILHGFK